MGVADFFFSSRRRHTRCSRDWSSDVCSSDLKVWKDHEDHAADEQVALLGLPPVRERDHPDHAEHRSEERRVGKSVDLGGRRIIKKKKKKNQRDVQMKKNNELKIA